MKEKFTRWSATDLALLLYAKKRKGLKGKELARLFNTTPAAIYQQLSKFDRDDLSKKMSDKFLKASILEFTVYSGKAPEQREVWDKKISPITGMTYQYPPKVEETADEVEDTFENTEEAPEVINTMFVPPQEKPLFSVDVNLQKLIEIIRTLQGR